MGEGEGPEESYDHRGHGFPAEALSNIAFDFKNPEGLDKNAVYARNSRPPSSSRTGSGDQSKSWHSNKALLVEVERHRLKLSEYEKRIKQLEVIVGRLSKHKERNRLEVSVGELDRQVTERHDCAEDMATVNRLVFGFGSDCEPDDGLDDEPDDELGDEPDDEPGDEPGGEPDDECDGKPDDEHDNKP